MDPRPYHYQYRRPRLTNPTYQSMNLYESLYHRDAFNRYQSTYNPSQYQPQNSFKPENNSPYENSKKNQQYIQNYANKFIQKNISMNNQNFKSILIDYNNPQSSRPNSNRSNKSQIYKQKPQRSSILASYGRNSIDQKQRSFTQEVKVQQKNNLNNRTYDRINQFTVFQRQQKPYNIIGNYPRATSTQLKKYPKLTLEYKLIEEGRYVPN